jgi:zinc transporter, ZIP family
LLRSLRRTGLEFVLALTMGLLAYLFVDLTLEGLALAQQASQVFQGDMLIWIPMALTFGALAAIGSRTRSNASGVRVAVLVALGIGLHNFGEGLAIGASLAVNQIALGTFLIIGFTLHNVTEGVGVVSPLTYERVPPLTFAALAALAGLPAVPGIWVGAFSFAPHWAAILFGIGAGAIVQVVIEIDRFLGSRVRNRGAGRFSPASAAGYTTGAAVMYATALLIAA